MEYRLDRQGNKISVLGYGCMRFSTKGAAIDIKKTEGEILRAVEGGINYFDTAYIYPGSEAALGEILEKNSLRDKVYIATKLPHYLLKKSEDMDRLFNEELRRLRTDHVDYYLMHMLNDLGAWERIQNLGILDWLEEKKKSGQIRQVGFSYHGNTDMFLKLLDAYDWDFTQIQYNYLDETSQAGVKGLERAAEKNVPVVIMEPLRGGRLANKLPEAAVKILNQARPEWSPAEWSFRWLWNQEAVTCVLSGMNSMEMIDENIKSASSSKAGAFTQEDFDTIKKVVKVINSLTKVSCTGCRYCMPCPKEVDIPGIFAAYNRSFSDNYFQGLKDYFMCTSIRSTSTGASNCIKCGKCELHCPQSIEIRKMLTKAKRRFETPIYKIVRFFQTKIMKY